jgi:hypothetical protein
MGCACKVSRHISNVEKKYGTKLQNPPKTHITERIISVFRSGIIALILIPFFPIMFLYVAVRSFFKKTPLNLYNIFKIKTKDVKHQ